MPQPPAYAAAAPPAAAPQTVPVTLHCVLCSALQSLERDPTVARNITAQVLLKAIRTNPMWAALTKAAVNRELYEGEKTGAFVRTQGAGGPPTWSLSGAVPPQAAPVPALPAPPQEAPAPPPQAPRVEMSPEIPTVSLSGYDRTGTNAYICLPEVSAIEAQIVGWLRAAGAVPFESVVAQAVAAPGMVMPAVNRLYIVANTREDAVTVPLTVATAVLLAQKTCQFGVEILECMAD